MGGGGKGGGTVQAARPQYIDPVTGMSYDSSSALNAAINARMAQEKTASEAAAAKAEAQKIADLAAFNTRLDSATNQARTNVNEYFTGLGVDPSLYASPIDNAINTRRGSVVSLDPNPYATFGDNLGQTIANSILTGGRTQAASSLDRLFGGNYAANELGMDLIDPVVEQVLGSQSSPIQNQLQNALKRRTLTEQGYGGALDAFNTDRTAARSTLNRLAGNVIASDRGDINNYLSSAYTSAGNLSLPSLGLFDPYQYYNEAEDRTQRYRDNLGGDVLNALGDTKLFDVQRLLNAGGMMQGATDPTATNPTGAIGVGGAPIGGTVDPNYIASQVLANRRRGLGTQGQF